MISRRRDELLDTKKKILDGSAGPVSPHGVGERKKGGRRNVRPDTRELVCCECVGPTRKPFYAVGAVAPGHQPVLGMWTHSRCGQVLRRNRQGLVFHKYRRIKALFGRATAPRGRLADIRSSLLLMHSGWLSALHARIWISNVERGIQSIHRRFLAIAADCIGRTMDRSISFRGLQFHHWTCWTLHSRELAPASRFRLPPRTRILYGGISKADRRETSLLLSSTRVDVSENMERSNDLSAQQQLTARRKRSTQMSFSCVWLGPFTGVHYRYIPGAIDAVASDPSTRPSPGPPHLNSVWSVENREKYGAARWCGAAA